MNQLDELLWVCVCVCDYIKLRSTVIREHTQIFRGTKIQLACSIMEKLKITSVNM